MDELTKVLQDELDQDLSISDRSKIQKNVASVADETGVSVKVMYEVEEKIGTKE